MLFFIYMYIISNCFHIVNIILQKSTIFYKTFYDKKPNSPELNPIFYLYLILVSLRYIWYNVYELSTSTFKSSIALLIICFLEGFELFGTSIPVDKSTIDKVPFSFVQPWYDRHNPSVLSNYLKKQKNDYF